MGVGGLCAYGQRGSCATQNPRTMQRLGMCTQTEWLCTWNGSGRQHLYRSTWPSAARACQWLLCKVPCTHHVALRSAREGDNATLVRTICSPSSSVAAGTDVRPRARRDLRAFRRALPQSLRDRGTWGPARWAARTDAVTRRIGFGGPAVIAGDLFGRDEHHRGAQLAAPPDIYVHTPTCQAATETSLSGHHRSQRGRNFVCFVVIVVGP